MNKKAILKKIGKYVVTIAMVLTAVNVNTCCWYAVYQPELPKGAEKLSKINR